MSRKFFFGGGDHGSTHKNLVFGVLIVILSVLLRQPGCLE